MAYLMMKMIGMLLQAQERGTGVEKMLGLGLQVQGCRNNSRALTQSQGGQPTKCRSAPMRPEPALHKSGIRRQVPGNQYDLNCDMSTACEYHLARRFGGGWKQQHHLFYDEVEYSHS